jgi:5-methyltetrahydropteroyltriglutamate--homocysteine methyltransferase
MGVDNQRSDNVESAAAIRAAVEKALCVYTPSRIFLNPDCGFGTFSNRPMNTWEMAAAKVGAMVAAARELRGSG